MFLSAILTLGLGVTLSSVHIADSAELLKL